MRELRLFRVIVSTGRDVEEERVSNKSDMLRTMLGIKSEEEEMVEFFFAASTYNRLLDMVMSKLESVHESAGEAERSPYIKSIQDGGKVVVET